MWLLCPNKAVSQNLNLKSLSWLVCLIQFFCRIKVSLLLLFPGAPSLCFLWERKPLVGHFGRRAPLTLTLCRWLTVVCWVLGDTVAPEPPEARFLSQGSRQGLLFFFFWGAGACSNWGPAKELQAWAALGGWDREVTAHPGLPPLASSVADTKAKF